MRLPNLITANAPKTLPTVNGFAIKSGTVETSVREVAIDDLHIDPEYQRAINPRFVDYLVKRWDAAVAGLLSVAEREDGLLFVFDGQHRLQAMRQLGWTHALCYVVRSKSSQHEADQFLDANTVNRQQAIGKFRAALHAKRPEAVELAKTVEDAGWTLLLYLGRGNKVGCTCAITALQNLYKRDKERLGASLRLLLATWPNDPAHGDARVLNAMFQFLTYGGDKVDHERFVKHLSREQLGPLTRRGLANSHELAIGPATGIAREFAAVYNKRLTGDNRITFVGAR